MGRAEGGVIKKKNPLQRPGLYFPFLSADAPGGNYGLGGSHWTCGNQFQQRMGRFVWRKIDIWSSQRTAEVDNIWYTQSNITIMSNLKLLWNIFAMVQTLQALGVYKFKLHK